jgi:hypothetical protein
MAGPSPSGTSLSCCGTTTSSAWLSPSSDGALGESRPYACSRRNCVQVGPIRRGRGAEAALAKHRGDGRGRDVDAEFQELAPDPEVAPPGVLAAQAEDQLLDRGMEGRATGPAGPGPRLLASSRRHRRRVSRPTKKLLHLSGDRNPAAAASNARSASVKRGRIPPRRRIFNWWWSTAASRSHSSAPHRRSRRITPQTRR